MTDDQLANNDTESSDDTTHESLDGENGNRTAVEPSTDTPEGSAPGNSSRDFVTRNGRVVRPPEKLDWYRTHVMSVLSCVVLCRKVHSATLVKLSARDLQGRCSVMRLTVL